ncbi:mechanosensitive ion channel domain-containing protein [Afifella pfennigii]|uniref:mechanosensitive ion channel domain-containing protein n=1 Tax=Afifella pfennigii TaxID=209897 RepID=UPI00068B6C0C|nr:mechanosensitive ion channel domain-containing protein [Afifella pfennigii]
MPFSVPRALSLPMLLLAALMALAPLAEPVSAQSLLVPGLSGGGSGEASGESGGSEGAVSSELKAKLLADILKDDRARQALIEELERIADPQAADSQVAASEERIDESFARRLADGTKAIAEASFGVVEKLWRDLTGLGTAAAEADRLDWDRLWDVVLRLLGTIAVTIVSLHGMSFLLHRLAGFLCRKVSGPKAVVRTVCFVIETLADALALAIAWTLGFTFAIVAIAFFSGGRELHVEQSLYLNAFLIVGGIRILLRAVLAPRPHKTALIPFRENVTDFAFRRILLLAQLLIYGLGFVVPMANADLSFLVGRGLRVLIMIVVAGIALASIRVLAHRLKMPDDQPPAEDIGGQLLRFIRWVWPWLAALYVLAIFVIGVTKPYLLVSFVGGASVRTALAIGIGVGLILLLRRAVKGGIRVPKWLSRNTTFLEQHLNRLIPLLLQIARILIVVAVLFAIVDAWDVFDTSRWLTSDTGTEATARFVAAFIIAGGAYGLWILTSAWIEHRLSGANGSLPSARARTLLSLLRNALTIALIAIGGMLVLAELGVNIGPLLAGAGVLGLAVGFGAQKLVQDIITGVFIQFENAINEGDVVTVAGISGVVEKLTVRSVGIRDLSGVYHIVPFSSVEAVSNFMRKFGYHLAEIGIAYRENVAEAKEAMREAFERLKESDFGTDIIDDFEMHGVVSLGDSAVVIRARVKTLPGSQWAIGRAYTEYVKEVFDERGIEIPFPHRTLYLGTYKDGSHDTLPISVAELGQGGEALPKAGEGGSAQAEGAAAPAAPEDEKSRPKRRRPRRRRSAEPKLPEPKQDGGYDDGD